MMFIVRYVVSAFGAADGVRPLPTSCIHSLEVSTEGGEPVSIFKTEFPWAGQSTRCFGKFRQNMPGSLYLVDVCPNVLSSVNTRENYDYPSRTIMFIAPLTVVSYAEPRCS